MRRQKKDRREPVIEAVELRRREQLYSRPIRAVAAGLACVGVLLVLLRMPFGRDTGTSPDDVRSSSSQSRSRTQLSDFLKTLRAYRPSAEVLVRSGTVARGTRAEVKVGGTARAGNRLAYMCQGPGSVRVSQRPVEGSPTASPAALGNSALRCDGALVDFEANGPVLITLEPTDTRTSLFWAVTYKQREADTASE